MSGTYFEIVERVEQDYWLSEAGKQVVQEIEEVESAHVLPERAESSFWGLVGICVAGVVFVVCCTLVLMWLKTWETPITAWQVLGFSGLSLLAAIVAVISACAVWQIAYNAEKSRADLERREHQKTLRTPAENVLRRHKGFMDELKSLIGSDGDLKIVRQVSSCLRSVGIVV